MLWKELAAMEARVFSSLEDFKPRPNQADAAKFEIRISKPSLRDRRSKPETMTASSPMPHDTGETPLRNRTGWKPIPLWQPHGHGFRKYDTGETPALLGAHLGLETDAFFAPALHTEVAFAAESR